MELFSLVAALPIRLASALPPDIVISGFKARSDIFMAAVADKPLLLRLGQVRCAFLQPCCPFRLLSTVA